MDNACEAAFTASIALTRRSLKEGAAFFLPLVFMFETLRVAPRWSATEEPDFGLEVDFVERAAVVRVIVAFLRVFGGGGAMRIVDEKKYKR